MISWYIMSVEAKMTPCGIKIPTILLICFSLLSLDGSAETDGMRRVHVNGNLKLRSPLLTREDGSLVFATLKIRRNVEVLECVMHVVGLSGPEITYPFNYRKNDIYKLPLIDLRLDVMENVVYVILKEPVPLFRFNVTILAIDLTSGSVSQLDLPPGSPYQDVVVSFIIDHNGANFLLRDASVCGKYMPRCKFTFNKRGERLAGPVSFPIKDGILSNFPKAVKLADKRSVLYQSIYLPDLRRSETRSIYIDASGNTTILHRFSHDPSMFSDTGDLFLACSFIDWDVYKIDCAQYDWKLNETIAFKFSLNDSSEDANRIESVASLAKAKILVLHFECGEDSNSECKNARVSSINSDGQVLKTTHLFDALNDPEFKVVNGAAIVEVDNQFCFRIILRARLVDPSRDPFRSDVYTECIPKSDL